MEVALENITTGKPLIGTIGQANNIQLDSLQGRIIFFVIAIVSVMLLVALIAILIYHRWLRQLHRQVLQQKDDLAELNATKDRILSIISHDLRSPIASLFGVVTFAQSGDLSPAEIKEIMDELSAQLKNSMDIMDRLLAWGSFEFKREQAAAEFQPLQELQATLQMISHNATQKGIAFTHNIDGQLTLKTNPYHFDFTLRNLLQNAIKFTPAGGSVTLNYTPTAGRHTFEIIDTGVGMAPELREKLFTVSMESNRGTGGEKGIGIALMLAKKYADADGNALYVASSGSTGTTFHFEVPAGN